MKYVLQRLVQRKHLLYIKSLNFNLPAHLFVAQYNVIQRCVDSVIMAGTCSLSVYSVMFWVVVTTSFTVQLTFKVNNMYIIYK